MQYREKIGNYGPTFLQMQSSFSSPGLSGRDLFIPEQVTGPWPLCERRPPPCVLINRYVDPAACFHCAAHAMVSWLERHSG